MIPNFDRSTEDYFFEANTARKKDGKGVKNFFSREIYLET